MKFTNLFINKVDTPWEKYFKKAERKIKVPNHSLYQAIEKVCKECPDAIAIRYFNKTISFNSLLKLINKCARAFKSQGVREGDVVTICMPNTPEGVISIYALNKIGAIANMIHPLSGEEEIKEYINSTRSTMLVIIDMCFQKVKHILNDTNIYKTIIVSPKNSMTLGMKIGYALTNIKNYTKIPKSEEFISWNDFMFKGSNFKGKCECKVDKDKPAIILHSGGTTGSPKGIVLTSYNFNALVEQSRVMIKGIDVGDSILTIMPIFHGFGLGICTHVPLCFKATVTLLPKFNAKKFDELILKYKPNVLIGVPTLWEAILNNKGFDKIDLSNLKYMISGGDCLSTSLEEKLNNFLKNHGASIKMTKGYGLTESLAAVTITYGKANPLGCIGIPAPGNKIKIVEPHTQETVPYGMEGEICVTGPTQMLGYLDNEKETNLVLQEHKDKHIWLHTGDIGYMTEDGIVYYTQRLKRMIVSSGYNVYPNQIETVIEKHPSVLKCTVVGIPHPYKVQVAKAFIVLKNDTAPNLKIKKEIKDLCEKNLARFSWPYEYEYRKSLPKTLIGKINYRALEEDKKHEDE